MADFQEKVIREIEWENTGKLQPGDRVRVIINSNTILDKTVPAGKIVHATIIIRGDLEDAPPP